MSRSMHEVHANQTELRSYLEILTVEALRDGAITPNALLECIYYSIEPDLFAAMRAFAKLDLAERLMVMRYAKKLSDERPMAG